MKYSSKAVYFSFFFFFKQKTAYEMLSGDWSSDVCSSDLKENAEEKEDPNSEKAWRKRFGEQHTKIAKAEKELDILQRELQKSQVQYYADPTKAMNEQNNRSEINDKTAKMEAKKKELVQLRQQLDDMETELRKSGGDPGWAQ